MLVKETYVNGQQVFDFELQTETDDLAMYKLDSSTATEVRSCEKSSHVGVMRTTSRSCGRQAPTAISTFGLSSMEFSELSHSSCQLPGLQQDHFHRRYRRLRPQPHLIGPRGRCASIIHQLRQSFNTILPTTHRLPSTLIKCILEHGRARVIA